jgi:hypothetical protein
MLNLIRTLENYTHTHSQINKTFVIYDTVLHAVLGIYAAFLLAECKSIQCTLRNESKPEVHLKPSILRSEYHCQNKITGNLHLRKKVINFY